MIKATDTYKSAVVGDSRRVHLKVVIDLSDPNTEIIGFTSNDQSKYSRPEQTTDHKYDIAKYATLEDGRWSLDGSYKIFSDAIPKDTEIGYLSNSMSDSDGAFATPVSSELKFRNVSVLQYFSVHFSKNPDDGVPSDFSISVWDGGAERYKQDFSSNTSASIELSGFTIYSPAKIVISVRKMSKPHRRLRIAEIMLGLYESWDENQLSEFTLKQQGDTSCVSLPYGTCNITLDNANRRFEPRRKSGLFQSISEQQKVEVSIGVLLPDGTTEYKKLGDYYQKGDGWKTSDNNITIQWNLVDIVGLLSDRIFNPPSVLPTTLEGWAKTLCGQLGKNFENRYKIDPAYKSKPVAVKNAAELVGLTCGDLIRYAAMASDTWPRADNSTGFLTFEPLWNEGNKITLDNLEQYPTMSANKNISIMFFDMWDGKPPLALLGNSASASDTVSVKNPFIHDPQKAMVAARNILSVYGGNQVEITGRGDPTSEIGDVDTIWLDESVATTARRSLQSFSMSAGILKASSTLIQADGSLFYEGRAVIKNQGTWKAPAGKNRLRIIIVGSGEDGGKGKDGTWQGPGEEGTDGLGGKVWNGVININDGQEFSVRFVGKDVLFGNYSSANGQRYPYGYTDVQSGESYARPGVKEPAPNSGDGGYRGKGGRQGRDHKMEIWNGDRYSWIWVDDELPSPGEPGSTGATGCVIVYWEK